MAVSFSGTGYAEFSSSVPTPSYMTIAAWVYSTSTTGLGSIVGRDNAGVGTGIRIFQFRRNASRLEFVPFNSSGTVYVAQSNTTISINTWYHVVGTFDGSIAQIWLNGSADDLTPPSVTGTMATGARPWIVGAQNNTTTTNYRDFWSGRIAEAAQWSVALSDAEIAALADGIRPKFIRPDALDAYVPLWGRYTEADEIGGFTATELNKSHADHPRIVGGRAGRRRFFPAVLLPITAELPIGSLTLAGVAPTGFKSALVDVAGVTLAGLVPATLKTSAIAPASLSLTGVSPDFNRSVAVDAGALAVSGLAPGTRKAAGADVGTASLTGVVPATSKSTALAATSLTISGVVPASTHAASLQAASLAVTGVTPTTFRAASVDVGPVALAGVSPATTKTVAIAAAGLQITGLAAGSAKAPAVPIGIVTLAGLSPVDQSLVPVGALLLSGVAPGVARVAPLAAAALTLTGIAPASAKEIELGPGEVLFAGTIVESEQVVPGVSPLVFCAVGAFTPGVVEAAAFVAGIAGDVDPALFAPGFVAAAGFAPGVVIEVDESAAELYSPGFVALRDRCCG